MLSTVTETASITCALRSRRYELKGKRSHQHSLRLNMQYRLIVEREKSKAGITLVIMGVEDYH